MSIAFDSMSDPQLRAHCNALIKLVQAKSECDSSQELRDLLRIETILSQRTVDAAGRALLSSAAGSSGGGEDSSSPYLFPTPRKASHSTESRVAALTVRLEGSAEQPSPPKTARGTDLSALSTADECQFVEVVTAVNTKALAVHPEHPSAAGEAFGSLHRVVGLSPPLAVAPATPLRIGAGHSAFVHPIPGSVHMSPAHSRVSRVISRLVLDELSSVNSSDAFSVEPERPKRTSLIPRASTSPRLPLLEENAEKEEDLESKAAMLRGQEESLYARWRREEDEEAGRGRGDAGVSSLFNGVSLLNPPADPALDPLYRLVKGNPNWGRNG